MAVFAKFDGLKRPPVGNDWSFGVVRCLTSVPAQTAMQQAGFSRAGIDELVNNRSISNENDRKLIAAIVAAAVG